MTTANTTTREAWLKAAAAHMAPWFAALGHDLPKGFRVSCGWPSRKALGSKRALGQCWSPEASNDKTTEIFVSPCLDEAVRVLDVLVHELVHAAVGIEEGHKGKFRAVALAIGLQGKMTATEAGEELKARLQDLVGQIGAYPHATLDAALCPEKKQTTRMIKLACPECGYTVRTSQKWIEVGMPTCCCGEEMKEAG